MGLMLGALRRICQIDRLLRGGQWPRTQGQLLAAQSVGIVGLGRVGRRVARLCQAFDAKVVAHDSYVKQPPQGIELVSLERLLAEANIVSLHLTYDADTHHLLDRAAFARMKPGAVVINTARGGLIDETALAEALAPDNWVRLHSTFSRRNHTAVRCSNVTTLSSPHILAPLPGSHVNAWKLKRRIICGKA